MVKSVQFLRKLVKTKAFAPYLAEEAEPGPGVSDSETDIEEWVRGAVRTEYHLIGTASMMPRSDGGVVDTKLKVYGQSSNAASQYSLLMVISQQARTTFESPICLSRPFTSRRT